MNQLEIWDLKRQDLLELVQRQAEIADILQSEDHIEVINAVQHLVTTYTFKVLVIGEFKAGKSTFINALLHDRVLPAYAIPTTAVISEVKWGVEPRAFLHYLPDKNGNVQPSMEVPVQDLEEYIVIKDFGTKEDELRDSLYAKAELYWPLELCRQGVEIIDSPGLNESIVREKITREYVALVDAVLFMFSATQFGPSMAEQNTIENLRSAGHKEIFFVVSRFDLLQSLDDQEQVRRYATDKLKHYTDKPQGIFFISSQQALDGHLDDDVEKLVTSCIKPLEEELKRFLAEERGRIKLLHSSHKLQLRNNLMRRTIPELLAMQRTEISILEKRYDRIKSRLEDLHRDRDLIVTRIANFRQDQREIIFNKAKAFYKSMLDRIPTWINDYHIQHPIQLRDVLDLTSASNRVLTEIVEFTTGKVEIEFRVWQESDLVPHLMVRIEELRIEIATRADEFISRLDELRLEVSEGINAPQFDQLQQISSMDRLVGTVVGFAFGGFAGAGVGWLFGMQEMLKTLLLQFCMGWLAGLMGFGMIAAVPLALAIGPLVAAMKLSEANVLLKRQVLDKFVEELSTTADSQATNCVLLIDERLGDIQRAIDVGMLREVDAVRKDLDREMEIKRKGGTEVQKRINELEGAEKAAAELGRDLAAYIQRLQVH